MRIVIEAIQDSEYVTGTDRIANNVLRELQNLDTTNTYIVICARDFDYVPAVVTAPNFRVVRRRSWRGPVLVRLGRVVRLLQAAYYRWVVRPNVYYCVANLAAPSIEVCAQVTDGLDLIPLVFPERYFGSEADHQRFLAKAKAVAGSADRLVAISEYTKRDLVDRLGADPNKVEVAYLAAEQRFQPIHDVQRLRRVRERYSLPTKFVLTIGSNEPRKNVVTVIEAYGLLPKALRQERSLVVAGGAWKGGRGDEVGELDGVRFTGFVADEDLPVIYSAAEAFVFLSTYEGFGLPPLEVMACGTPVVSSNATSIPEATGEAVLLVPPLDAKAAAAALERILTDKKEARRLRAVGLEQAARFTWKKTAEQIHKVLEEVGGHE